MQTRKATIWFLRFALVIGGIAFLAAASRYFDKGMMCTAIYSDHYPDALSTEIEPTCRGLWNQAEKSLALGVLCLILLTVTFIWKRIWIGIRKAPITTQQ